jgi:hypothetical protein
VAFWSHPKHWAYRGKINLLKMRNCITTEASVPNLATWLFKCWCSHRMITGVRFPTCWHLYKTQIERVNIKSRLKTTDKLWEVQKHSNAVQAVETSIGCRALQVINTRMLEAHILAGWIHTMLRSNCQFSHSHDAVSANNQCANN